MPLAKAFFSSRSGLLTASASYGWSMWSLEDSGSFRKTCFCDAVGIFDGEYENRLRRRSELIV
jgi:hypothetical protein